MPTLERQDDCALVTTAAVLGTAIAPAQAQIAKAGPTVETIKTRMYATVLAALKE